MAVRLCERTGEGMFRIGILGAADIAYNKFLPALEKVDGAQCAGVASNSPDKLARFVEKYGVKVYASYDEVIEDESVDCVYIPLPPAFHYQWARKALLAGKHVFLEKPSTTSAVQTAELVGLARENGLVLQENYMFRYHKQLKAIEDIIASGELGKLRLVRTSFGFPRRAEGDFRYVKELGGGTMMDNGGYTIKLAQRLLGSSMKLVGARLDFDEKTGVDIFGTADFINSDGLMAQAAFGMDCQYQCSLELWGSRGRLTTGRIFTAPDGFKPTALIETGSGSRTVELPACDAFEESIKIYLRALEDSQLRGEMASELIRQAELVDEVRNAREI